MQTVEPSAVTVLPAAISISAGTASSSPAIRTGETYTVKPGETFNGIATRAGIPRSVLAQANGLTAPYVVKEGQTVLIVEAMKTMNAIPAPRSGTVTRVLVGNAQPVEYGEPLLIIE